LFRLAHVTDPHFRGFAGARPWDFFNKRLLGTLNIVLVRRRKHRMELLESLRRDLAGRAVDHLALTGDLGNVSLEGEWKAARRWIEEYGRGSEAVTVIPGNHDAYVESAVKSGGFERIFGAYQTADLRLGSEHYPFVRFRGDVALLAVNSCVPTGDTGAWGEIGEGQRARLEALLTMPEVAKRVRVVLIHHPPVVHRPGEDRNLRDRDALVALLARTGADLVLHGHDHRDEHAAVQGPGGKKIPIIGAGSASYAGKPEHRARYNVYEIEGRTITAVTYSHDVASDTYREAGRRRLDQQQGP
jgi:3',5'-cyclic AMP phosphodiesterase CpdA